MSDKTLALDWCISIVADALCEENNFPKSLWQQDNRREALDFVDAIGTGQFVLIEFTLITLATYGNGVEALSIRAFSENRLDEIRFTFYYESGPVIETLNQVRSIGKRVKTPITGLGPPHRYELHLTSDEHRQLCDDLYIAYKVAKL